MPAIKDITQLGKLIALQHGWAAAKAFKAYEMDEADQAALSHCAIDLLKIFPPTPDTSALMSAALAVSLERHMKAPIHVVAGTLALEGVPVFGNRQPFDGSQVLGTSSSDWNGHVWVMIGPYVVDISIFRTAYSAEGPARLAKHIDLTFGPKKGLYVDHWKRTRQVGLNYEPQYVLDADEVTALMGRAFDIIKQARPASAS
ncbi:hypothetical protein OLX02_12795 [Novosphingobium sp. KCTC 2891]|uniref:hypothetical protein n=1 Tax=Novosphingobium sp. KCTC 2891 TaxID=2989730 RepID=UPI002221AF56|nr:hypothetical protein [Novosphingobium sp. KCTC 2891]MCW1383700.1 hypothetical protein [Novosphingobium sp. KCTC 2891]